MNPVQIKPPVEHLNEPVLRFARKDFATLNQKFTVEQALASIRQRGVGEKIVYFYVVDDDGTIGRRRADAPIAHGPAGHRPLSEI